MFNIRYFNKGKWNYLLSTGDNTNLVSDSTYEVKVQYYGSRITLIVNDVVIGSVDFPAMLPASQVGLWCSGEEEIVIKNFSIEAVKPKAFVVMQFTEEFDELYNQVVKRVCNELNMDTVRADDIYGPGQIISDISQQIREAQFIIADITPKNPNVYYEVGFAHALKKETILLAEKSTPLPFDIASFRVVFYNNTIGGKPKVEEDLRRHIKSIVNKSVSPA
jgi:hypothetical protein